MAPINQERNIALVVIDAVASDIDENPDVAKANIKKLAESPGIGKAYWLQNANFYPSLGTREYQEQQAMKCPYLQGLEVIAQKADPQTEMIKDAARTATDIILAGGSLRNQHYEAFHFVMQQLRCASRIADIHVPLDCTYSFSQHYDSGESWTEGEIGRMDMEVVSAYPEAMPRIATPGYIVKVDGKATEQSSVMTLYIWSTTEKMLDHLAATPKR